MGKWECTVCGHIYDAAQGDRLSGVAADTAFGDLPEDWRCPICRSGKDAFQRVVE